MADFADDLDAAAALGWGPEALDKLASSGVDPGVFATFRSFDPETRALVVRLLDSPTEADFAELDSLPHGTALAQWLLTLPAYRDAPDEDEDEDWSSMTRGSTAPPP